MYVRCTCRQACLLVCMEACMCNVSVGTWLLTLLSGLQPVAAPVLFRASLGGPWNWSFALWHHSVSPFLLFGVVNSWS